MPTWEDEIHKTIALIKENKRRVEKARKLVVELRELMHSIRGKTQASHDRRNPKIIPLSLSPKSQQPNKAISRSTKKQKPTALPSKTIKARQPDTSHRRHQSP
jgi:uncharacterized protein YktB (UPF0637 family)